ncbi:nitrous oxide reductase accessory protein NosL [Leptospira adleri]|uniref:Accessory protein NosL n=1 Tax=Leptospira adleri TaxID=2023186 RepID=A0A2M9YKJ2_9LEPT|nr:nitrous oxide reductase accessory protein NosL [Leptospira adleri]PJZ52063.1 accessory protein NosL [Leptospira adleri]PJZ62925.1 accessory protein NosL [Leptospira adleri]
MKFRISLWTILFACLSFVSCVRKEPVIPERGREKCSHCSMSIVDMRFQSQLLTDKGRRYYFDSIECLQSYRENLNSEVILSWVTDFEDTNRMLKENEATIVQSPDIHSPMGKGLAAFASFEKASEYLRNHQGFVVTSGVKK